MTTTTQASIDRREKKYQALVALIERWQRKLEKADKTMHKAVRTIATLERHRSKLRRAIERAKLERPHLESDPKESSAPMPSSEPRLCSVPISHSDPRKQSAPITHSVPSSSSEPTTTSVPKKRQRKPKPETNGDATPDTTPQDLPKAGDPGPELLAQMFPFGGKEQSREARMEAAGFRKITKRR